MKICKSINIKKQKSVIQDIFCNICGERIHKNEFGYYDDFLSIEKRWGYHSDFDNETHCIDICRPCYKTFWDNLALKPDCNTEDEP